MVIIIFIDLLIWSYLTTNNNELKNGVLSIDNKLVKIDRLHSNISLQLSINILFLTSLLSQ